MKEEQHTTGSANWEGPDHPFYKLQERLDDAKDLRPRWKAIRELNYIRGDLTRFGRLAQHPDPHRLAEVKELINNAIKALYKNGAASKKEADLIFEEMGRVIASLIVLDEDAKFPGKRDADGCLNV